MELIGFLVLVLWALPMLLSMGTDKDHISTLSGTIFSDAAVFGEIWTLSKVQARVTTLAVVTGSDYSGRARQLLWNLVWLLREIKSLGPRHFTNTVRTRKNRRSRRYWAV